MLDGTVPVRPLLFRALRTPVIRAGCQLRTGFYTKHSLDSRSCNVQELQGDHASHARRDRASEIIAVEAPASTIRRRNAVSAQHVGEAKPPNPALTDN